MIVLRLDGIADPNPDNAQMSLAHTAAAGAEYTLIFTPYIDAWQTLPEAVRADIVAMAKG